MNLDNMHLDNRRRIEGLLFLVLFGLTIPAANWLIGHVGTSCARDGPCVIPVAPGIFAPSGVLMIGIALVLRDLVQRRLGIGVSLCAFVVVTMAMWALLSNALDLSLKGVDYVARIFLAPPPDAGQSTAQAYLHQRYVSSTETFAPVAILLLTLLA